MVDKMNTTTTNLWRGGFIHRLAVIAFLTSGPIGLAQKLFAQAGRIDPSFYAGIGSAGNVSGPSSLIWAVAVQGDGKPLIAGNFNSVDGVPRGRVARLNSDGSLDLRFDTRD